LNIFSDNESRLFFSNFILFVEGETELEIFGNKKLLDKFPILQKIDIYKSSSNVLGSYINPSYSNTTIPYLFLFDADKIYSFNRKSTNPRIRILSFENKNKNLYRLPDEKQENEEEIEKLVNKYKKGFSRKYKDKLVTIEKLQTVHNKEFNFNKLSFKIDEVEEYNESIKLMKNYLNDYNVKFLHTTIEEVLINISCKKLFFNWLKNEYGIKKTNFSKRKGKKRKFITNNLLVEYFRLLFDGKMETLVSYKHISSENNKNHLSRKILKCLHSKLNKQDKWLGNKFFKFCYS